jgi:hypothetical protein
MADEFSTYDQIGKAEDVSAIISNIEPYDTPFQTLTGTQKVKARNPEWQADSLNAPSGMIAASIEGAAYVNSARVATTMNSNYTEIRRTSFSVTETSDAITTHGRARETAYQLAKAGKELKKAFEIRLLSHAAADTDAVAGVDAALGNATDTAREAGNVWGEDVSSNDILDNRSAATTSQVEFTADAFLTGMKQTYDEGAPGKILMVEPTLANTINNWSTLTSGRTRDMRNETKMVMVVEFLVTPFGEVKVVLNRNMGYAVAGTKLSGDLANDALLFDPSYWKIGTLRPWNKLKLAKTSDSESYALRGEFTLIHKNYDEGYGWTNLEHVLSA